jgi:hypothetical protein
MGEQHGEHLSCRHWPSYELLAMLAIRIVFSSSRWRRVP